jgi:hypothetical protein
MTGNQLPISGRSDKENLLVEVNGATVLARRLDDGKTLEVLQVCTGGRPNTNSFLYGLFRRIANLMGYERAITCTQDSPAQPLARWPGGAHVTGLSHTMS